MENSSNDDNKLVLEDLKKRVQTLRNQDLITEAEKNAVINAKQAQKKEKLFNLLMAKNIYCSIRMLELLRNETANNISNEDAQVLNTAKNPLKIAGIIKCVFTFLSLKDIKNCRLVNKEWNHVAEPFLRLRAQISIGYPADPKCFKKSMKDFDDAFKFCQTAIPFTALRLMTVKGNSAPWPKSAIEKVFNKWGANLKQLTISCELGLKSTMFSLNTLSLNNEILITRLNVCPPTVKGHPDGRLQFSLEKFVNIKYLLVEGCNLSIPDGYSISPIEVEIKFSIILYKGEKNKFEFNNFIDFKDTKRFTYHGLSIRSDPSRMKLNMIGNFELKLLYLSEACILNWKLSNWTVDKMILCETNFSGLTQVKVREFFVDSYCTSISFIPVTVEKLTFTSTNTNISESVVFPNLKHLTIFPESRLESSHFKSYPSLVKLEVQEGIGVSIDWLPPSLRKLRIWGSLTTMLVEKDARLGTLILESYCVDNADKLFDKFHAAQNVWSFSKSVENFLDGKKLNKILEILMKKKIKVAVGKFNWKKVDFANSPFYKCVDKMSEYYLFQNKKGVAITQQQFEEMMDL